MGSMMIEGARLSQSLLEAPKKAIAIKLRWMVIIVCSYLLLSSDVVSTFSIKIHGFILLYILSNIELCFIDEKLFETSYFYAPLVLLDAFFLTASLMLSGQASADFYLVYFLPVILAGSQGLWMRPMQRRWKN